MASQSVIIRNAKEVRAAALPAVLH
jgi:hypothetical protein